MFDAYLVPIMTDVPFIIGPPLYEKWTLSIGQPLILRVFCHSFSIKKLKPDMVNSMFIIHVRSNVIYFFTLFTTSNPMWALMCIIEYTNLVKIKDVRKVFCWTPRDLLPSTNFKLKTIEYKSGKNIFFHLKIKQFWCMWVLAFSKPVFVYKHLPLTINHYFTK